MLIALRPFGRLQPDNPFDDDKEVTEECATHTRKQARGKISCSTMAEIKAQQSGIWRHGVFYMDTLPYSPKIGFAATLAPRHPVEYKILPPQELSALKGIANSAHLQF